jgi:hypothetical protein
MTAANEANPASAPPPLSDRRHINRLETPIAKLGSRPNPTLNRTIFTASGVDNGVRHRRLYDRMT